MKLEEHCKESQAKLSKPFKEVHEWLDEFFCDYENALEVYGLWNLPLQYRNNLTRHRCLRHTQQGIEKVRERWGDEAAEAAKLHILADLKLNGYNTGYIPEDTEEYLKLGLW